MELRGKEWIRNPYFPYSPISLPNKMKSLLLAPFLVSFANTDYSVESIETEVATPLVAIATVVDRPIVELANVPEFVPIVAQDGEDERVLALRQDLEDLAANLVATQRSVETVAEQRDQAREEVRALAKANHEMLKEMKAFRQEMETARAEGEQWKTRATFLEERANEQALANADIQKFRTEMRSVMEEFHAMKGDITLVREELQDPIERANLKEQLAEGNAKQERLGDEIEMALIAREKTILEAARTRKELDAKIAELTTEAQAAVEMRDDLRSANAVKMKALADVEVLKKQLGESNEIQASTIAELQVAQEGMLALQAEKTAAVEARMVANQERDQAQSNVEDLKGQIDEVRAEAEASKIAFAELTNELKNTEVLRQETGKELETAAGALDKSQEEVVFLNKAKGGLEELLFKKTAEIRKLKGELQKVHASRDKADGPAESPKAEDPAEKPEKKSQATARAD